MLPNDLMVDTNHLSKTDVGHVLHETPPYVGMQILYIYRLSGQNADFLRSLANSNCS